ncbi:hypothetical protein H6P81_011332 [Aristolochia fimbriata]|uniref:Uncharacterized protein n=2 Tax=Aristolochia TaxID=12947 RepID=A0AAV7EUQ0_ARIFI|nr:hypothetical protein H6P81_011332 [Aristolochia fimbriata]
MGRSPCCDKVGLKKGPWTPEEDQKLLAYIEQHGHGSWRALPSKAGLQRCGKSCRLRWTNYLRPDIKRGKFSLQEEQTIIQLHALLGNRWSAIATHLPKRTDNEIKNYWNTHLKKRLTKMGIDPVTHKPKTDALGTLVDGHAAKTAANLSHMAQWESARLEAEARLVRESKLRSSSTAAHHHLLISDHHHASSSSSTTTTTTSSSWPPPPLHHHQPTTTTTTTKSAPNSTTNNNANHDLESPTSTLSFSENMMMSTTNSSSTTIPTATIELFIDNSDPGGGHEDHNDRGEEDTKGAVGSLRLHDLIFQSEEAPMAAVLPGAGFMEGFTDLLLQDNSHEDDDEQHRPIHHSSSSPDQGDEAGRGGGGEEDPGDVDGHDDEGKSYWNNILNLVNSSPSDSPMF